MAPAPISDRLLQQMLRAAERVDRARTDREIMDADENWDIHIGQHPTRIIAICAELRAYRATAKETTP
jgi:hypothetical protein